MFSSALGFVGLVLAVLLGMMAWNSVTRQIGRNDREIQQANQEVSRLRRSLGSRPR